MIERFSRDQTGKQVRRGVLRDLEQRFMAIADYIDQHNGNLKPSSGPQTPTTSLKTSPMQKLPLMTERLFGGLHLPLDANSLEPAPPKADGISHASFKRLAEKAWVSVTGSTRKVPSSWNRDRLGNTDDDPLLCDQLTGTDRSLVQITAASRKGLATARCSSNIRVEDCHPTICLGRLCARSVALRCCGS